MNEKQAAKIAARKSKSEGTQYVVWVLDQGRDVYDREQTLRYQPFLQVEAIYANGVQISSAVALAL